MKEDDESMQIHAAPGTCCPDMKLGLDGICTGCGHDHKLDAVIAELALRRDWVEKCANIESKNARAMLTGARQEYHLAMARAYRRVRGHLKARIRYLLSLDKIRRERWLESIPDVRSSESNKAEEGMMGGISRGTLGRCVDCDHRRGWLCDVEGVNLKRILGGRAGLTRYGCRKWKLRIEDDLRRARHGDLHD